MAGQNLFGANDSGNTTKLAGMPGAAEKFFGQMGKHMDKMVKASTIFESNLKKAAEHWSKVTGNSGPGGKLGLGSFTRSQQVGLGLGAVTVGAGALAMSMAPNTMSAVTQRMAADTVGGLSGMSAQGVIRQSNRLVGNGATSAMGATMAQMNLTYQGGYLANTLSSKRIMGQLGGLSAITGGSNEQVASSLAGINGMNFIRMGVRARDSKGNLRAPNQIVNDVYRSLYGGRKITKDQAAMVLNPGSKGYYTLMQAAGGDQALFNTLAMGIIARASKGSSLTKSDLSSSEKSLDIMGVGKESPLRSLFRYNTSESRKLQATEAGLVGGYNVGLRTTASVNDGFSSLAEALPGVTQALMTFKGALQTFPSAGNTGATLSGLGSSALGMGMNVGSMMLAGRMLGVGGAAAGGGGGMMGGLGLMGMLRGGGGRLTGGLAKMGGGSMMRGLGRAGLAAGIYAGGEKLQQWLNKKGKNLPGWAKWLGNFAFDIGQGGLTGLAAGGVPGAFAGMAAGGVGNIATGGVGGADPVGCSHGNVGCSHGIGGDNSSSNSTQTSVYQSPVPPGTRITSGFGPRDNSKSPGISSNHQGVDYGVAVGSSVSAAADGQVTETGTHRQYGNYIIIKHKTGKSTLYAHLSYIGVSRGQNVAQGQEIGKSGGRKGAPGAGTSTGPHLHFEIRNNGGVGAAGRTNPLGLLGKGWNFIKGIFSKGINFIKKVGSGAKNVIFGGQDSPPRSNVGNLSSVSLGTLLSSSIRNGAPVSWEDIKDQVNGSTRVGLGTKGRSGHLFLNEHDDKVSGDKAGMAGGSRAGLMKMLYSAGFRGKGLETAFAVALAESGGRAGAVGDESLQDDKWGPSYGMFQIRSLKNWKKYKDPFRDGTRLKNPAYNAQAAYSKSNGGTGWKGWSAYTNGSFAKYLDDANRVSTAAGYGVGGGAETMGATETSPGIPMGRTGSGSAHLTTHSVINIDVDMDVTIARSSVAEAEHMLKQFKSKLAQELKLNGIKVN